MVIFIDGQMSGCLQRLSMWRPEVVAERFGTLKAVKAQAFLGTAKNYGHLFINYLTQRGEGGGLT